MLNDEEVEDLLFAVHSLLEGNGLTPHGIKKYKYLEQTLLNIKRGTHLTPYAAESKLDIVLASYRDMFGVKTERANEIHRLACEEVARLRVAEHSMQRTCANCGASTWANAIEVGGKEVCTVCGTSR